MWGVRVEPHVFVILGAMGDLTRRKLMPALHRLHGEGLLGEGSLIVGVSRHADMDDARFAAWAVEGLPDAERFAATIRHVAAADTPEGWRGLAGRLSALERERGLANRAFYLALPPAAFPATIDGLGGAGLGRSAGWARLVIEKPFGQDLKSAEDLNRRVHRHFDESQIYRIDHYLGKETVQNLLVFRFANAIFESLWNRDRIQSVEITVAEELGVERRGGYYEKSGALRDMVQNHLTQIMTLIAMEVPAAYNAEAVRHEKVKVLQSIGPVEAPDVVLGQYGPGRVEGEDVPGYRQEPGVAPDSKTPTFAALRLQVENWRWQGVPFYLRTGKRLARRTTEIFVTFRRAPVCLFTSFDTCQIHTNVLRLTMQPQEGFSLYFDVKQPGEPLQLKTLPLDVYYQEAFTKLPSAYETLLLDVLEGDQTLFVHADEVEGAWRLYAPLLESDLAVRPYTAGSWGPPESAELLARRGHRWQTE
jgi:glucose-6-phosphate 1-dehydrogenase